MLTVLITVASVESRVINDSSWAMYRLNIINLEHEPSFIWISKSCSNSIRLILSSLSLTQALDKLPIFLLQLYLDLIIHVFMSCSCYVCFPCHVVFWCFIKIDTFFFNSYNFKIILFSCRVYFFVCIVFLSCFNYFFISYQNHIRVVSKIDPWQMHDASLHGNLKWLIS